MPQRVIAASINLNWSRYRGDDYRKVSERLLEKIEALPGVTSAAVASSYPMNADRINFGGRPIRIQEEGEVRTEAEGVTARSLLSVTPGYFQTLGIPLAAGRTFSITDGPDAAARRGNQPLARGQAVGQYRPASGAASGWAAAKPGSGSWASSAT